MPVDGLASLPDGLPVLRPGQDLVLEGAEILHIFFEAPSDVVRTALPPALHPTIPGAMYVTAVRAVAPEWGPIAWAEVRLAARLREKPRAFLLGVAVEGGDPAALAAGWGMAASGADVKLHRWYDRVEVDVEVDGRVVLRAALLDPEPIPGATLQYGPLANPAVVGEKRSLALVDPVAVFGDDRQRGKPRISLFDGDWWGTPALRPTVPIGAYYAIVDLQLPAPAVAVGAGVARGGESVAVA